MHLLLGHSDLKATSIYLHLSERHLKAAGTPIDKVLWSKPQQVKRSRKLHRHKDLSYGIFDITNIRK